jgi:hypothetical protein
MSGASEMTGWDSRRVALVVARTPGKDSSGSDSSVATGYFVTGDLVLTVGHVENGPNAVFQVRADVGGPEAEHWSDAKAIWRGVGVDAVLLRTERSFGDWPLPSFRPEAEVGEWESAGYAGIAADTEQRNRKTLPLHGSFSPSRGQGDPELALVTQEQVVPGRVDRWRGISGAPVFLKDDGGLLGLITDARGSTTNVLVGLPISRLLDDIHFRTALQPSFFGDLPEEPWCLVITREGGSGDLRPQVANVLNGFRDSDPELGVLKLEPRELAVTDALSSVESWAASVEAMAKATVVVADVTGFQPGAMLLLGVRSVLRRGVTINVTGAPIASHASTAPFNVQETKVLSYADGGFYQDLRRAMSEGLANVRGDTNYLDLPSYHAVRSPRPYSWVVEDTKSALVLCPFGVSYSEFYDQKLNAIIQGNTGNKNPIRMLDIRSPRLVGQSLYEQIRWSTHCLVDWTGRRANVSFELGVRLASSEHDPLIVAQDRLDEDPTVEPLEQHRLLQSLLGIHVYDPGHPHEVLPQALKTWSRPDRRPDEAVNPGTLPAGATFAVALKHFDWRQEALLERPDRELRLAVERMVGKDPQRLPEHSVLYSAADDFNAELMAAVKEKWIAAWLYARHLLDASESPSPDDRPDFFVLSQLVAAALEGSTDPRYVRLREDIDRLLPVHHDQQETLDQVLAIKATAKGARRDEELGNAVTALHRAIVLLRTLATDAAPGSGVRLEAELADTNGVLGGVERRWGLASAGAARTGHLQRSVEAYDAGFEHERRLDTSEETTYNRINRLVGRVLLDPQVLVGDETESAHVRSSLEEAEGIVVKHIEAARQRDPWAHCDLGTIRLLMGKEAATVVQTLERLRAPRFVYDSWMATLGPLADVASAIRPELPAALALVERAARYAGS